MRTTANWRCVIPRAFSPARIRSGRPSSRSRRRSTCRPASVQASLYTCLGHVQVLLYAIRAATWLGMRQARGTGRRRPRTSSRASSQLFGSASKSSLRLAATCITSDSERYPKLLEKAQREQVDGTSELPRMLSWTTARGRMELDDALLVSSTASAVGLDGVPRIEADHERTRGRGCPPRLFSRCTRLLGHRRRRSSALRRTLVGRPSQSWPSQSGSNSCRLSRRLSSCARHGRSRVPSTTSRASSPIHWRSTWRHGASADPGDPGTKAIKDAGMGNDQLGSARR